MSRASVRFVYKTIVDVAPRMRKAAAEALQDVADAGLEEANKTIPLEEGIMQDSGFTELDDSALTSQIAYSTPYAVKQHEDPTLNHDPGREDHWLERSVERNRVPYAEFIAKKVRERMGG